MNRSYILIIIFLFIISEKSISQNVDSIYTEEAKNILRLKADSFDDLPREIKDYLNHNSYLIPQIFDSKIPVGVINGEFISKGVKDWAILASRNLKSKIIVFHYGKTNQKNIFEFGEYEDKTFLQGLDINRIVYSRCISTFPFKYFRTSDEWDDDQKPLIVDHDGIVDEFAEKASVIFYYYRDKWFRQIGAD